MSEQPDDTPRYQHDCDRCIFLGTFNDPLGVRDLYWCEQGGLGYPTVIARYSDDGPDYASGLAFADESKPPAIPALVEAKKRAKARGLKVEGGV